MVRETDLNWDLDVCDDFKLTKTDQQTYHQSKIFFAKNPIFSAKPAFRNVFHGVMPADAREIQLLAPDSSVVPLPRQLLGVNDQPEQEVEVLETATNSGAENGD